MTELTYFVWSFQTKFGRWVEKARQKPSAKLSNGTREIFEKRGLETTIFCSTLLISAPILTVVGWNKWKQTTKREHSWFGMVATLRTRTASGIFQRTSHMVRNHFAVASRLSRE